MKKILLIILITILGSNVNAQTSTFTYNALNAINFNSYVNKPVDSFLHIIPANYTTLKLVGNVNNNSVSYLFILYPDASQVIIRVKKYQYMNTVDSARIWNLSLYRKENANYISLYNLEYGFKDVLGN